ncbi:RagB/SusD family nutrient uptake outer membrane protein [Robertkochia marina]|uniref:RagB/SusD family nutrient uptake outer membrane protein n=1 Tax=Robertkochia marina TaxID=1227945 RepID=A0A4S3M3H6_9FLAO|nr:RagB/SusD family nutrient uptake outer membrane protein [Robertkochia marina]TRZ46935.1 RagB/SusD family nutrient uptake outer membrane protein [Robertkochia marina]
MMKYNTLKYMLMICLAAVTTVACTDDFVDVDSFDKNSESFFTTEEEYYEGLVAAYDLLQAGYLKNMVGEIASDNTLAGGESATDVIGIQEIDDMIHTPVNQQLRDIWSWTFAGVNRANYILEFKDNIDFPGKETILAEATFLRAYYYFDLVKWFGDVPLAVDKRFQFGDEQNVERTPKAEVYAQIEADLIYAASVLDYAPANGQIGRATKGAALALLGKVYLYQDKFSEAATVLQEVINSGQYALTQPVGADITQVGIYETLPNEAYEMLFERRGENGSESVFEVQYTDTQGAGFGCLQCVEGNVAVGFQGPRGYSGFHFDSGFSFSVPTQEAYDAYAENDVRRDLSILNIVTWNEATGSVYNEAAGYEQTGFFNRKYIPRQDDLNTGDPNLNNPANYRAIRYADVLLMAAEAINRGGLGDAQAREYLNQVRSRAGLADVTLSGNALTNAIYDERRLELMGEGHRFFDLVRTGRAAQTIPGFQAGKHELFPIPSVEIELAGNRWPQNPGY